MPQPDEKAEEWTCSGCGAAFTAVFVEDCPPKVRKNVRRKQDTRELETDVLAEVLASHGTLKHVPPTPRGIRSPLQTRLSQDLDQVISDPANLVIPPQGEPLSSRCVHHGATSYDEQVARQVVESHTLAVEQIGTTYQSFADGKDVDIDEILQVLNKIIEQSMADNDLMVCLGINAVGTDYPNRHSVHSAILSMSIGITMGLDEKTISEMGLGCLLHDIGMLAVAEHADTPRNFEVKQFMEIATHPVHTLELIQRQYNSVPDSSKMVAYQIHERCNGSGYPRGRTGDAIHDLAKIAMVADTYVALTTRRRHRPAMTPYYAVLKVLEEVREGQFDPTVVRGFIQTVSLFPIGSYVCFDDDLYGKVLRKNVNQYDRPVIEAWNASDPSQEPYIVDLAVATDWPTPRPINADLVKLPV
jgi:HD-GYP domain-containing protein (c-di-GMP phosphodiesterase class II)